MSCLCDPFLCRSSASLSQECWVPQTEAVCSEGSTTAFRAQNVEVQESTAGTSSLWVQFLIHFLLIILNQFFSHLIYPNYWFPLSLLLSVFPYLPSRSKPFLAH